MPDFDLCREANQWAFGIVAIIFVVGPLTEYLFGISRRKRIASGKADPLKVSGSLVELIIKGVISLFLVIASLILKRRSKNADCTSPVERTEGIQGDRGRSAVDPEGRPGEEADR